MNELRFPDPMEVARERGQEFQRLPSEQRWREIAALMAVGWYLVHSSPVREAIERQMNESEEEWRRIQRELFARHG